jgi:hypothetical protein
MIAKTVLVHNTVYRFQLISWRQTTPNLTPEDHVLIAKSERNVGEIQDVAPIFGLGEQVFELHRLISQRIVKPLNLFGREEGVECLSPIAI